VQRSRLGRLTGFVCGQNDEEHACCSDGETDISEEREYIPGQFEGPEKNLEICFKPGLGHPNGCRQLSRSALDIICAHARCTILSHTSNDFLDAYVLSESSLFVYSHKVLIKTCGKTTLLHCLHPLFRFTRELGLELEWLGYSRKNYTFPNDQAFPHSNFQDEFSYLKKHPQLEARLEGNGYILGPLTADHWLVYVSDKCDRPSSQSTDRTLNLMMFDLAPDFCSIFYADQNSSAAEMTRAASIDTLVPGSVIDDRAFQPCGYSMNAIYGSYTTVHITPEPECSYASFETNTPLKSYGSLVNNVLAAFRPGRVIITLLADAAGLAEMSENPFDQALLSIPGVGCYTRSSASFLQVEGDCCASMGTWELTRDSKDADDRALRRSSRAPSF
jgi:S-adenosylmethionine decarboxylase